MPAYWYAINSHPHKEDALYRQVQSQGIEAFYPCVRVNPVNPRSKKIRPYFPGYLFVHVDLEATGDSLFQWRPHARGLVSFGGEAARVPDALIHAIQRRVKEIAAAGGEVFDGLHQGDTVVIDSGPFAGFKCDVDKWEEMLDRLYSLHGWDVSTGLQPQGRLEEVGLEDVAEMLRRAGRLIGSR